MTLTLTCRIPGVGFLQSDSPGNELLRPATRSQEHQLSQVGPLGNLIVKEQHEP
jgi:hypothetical protein